MFSADPSRITLDEIAATQYNPLSMISRESQGTGTETPTDNVSDGLP